MLCSQPQICLPTGGNSLSLIRSHTILDYYSSAHFLLSVACCLHLGNVSQETLLVLGSLMPQTCPFCQLLPHSALLQSCLMVSGLQKGCSVTTSGL